MYAGQVDGLLLGTHFVTRITLIDEIDGKSHKM